MAAVPHPAAPVLPPAVLEAANSRLKPSATSALPSDSSTPSEHLTSLSSRGQRASQPLTPYWTRFLSAFSSPYSAANPDGYVLLTVAENVLNTRAWSDKAALCRQLDPDIFGYGDMTGREPLRAALARLMERRLSGQQRLSIQPADICLGNGVGSVLHTLAVLLCEPGDAVLIPAPHYAAFTNDLFTVACAVPVLVRTEADGYRLRRARFEAALRAFDDDADLNYEAHPVIDEDHFGGVRDGGGASGLSLQHEDANSLALYNKAVARQFNSRKRVKAVLLTNPNNPLGLLYEREELEDILSWAAERRLHVIVDEIYSNSIFNPLPEPQFLPPDAPPTPSSPSSPADSSPFYSALHQLYAESPLLPAHQLHVLQGLSKDFGLGGYRVGWVVTRNTGVREAWKNVGYFCSVSSDTQELLRRVLADELWVDEFLYRNAELLLDSYTALTQMLDGSHSSLQPARSPLLLTTADLKSQPSASSPPPELLSPSSAAEDDPSFSLPYLPATAGMFVWLDLRGFLPATVSSPPSAASPSSPRLNVWQHEEALFDALYEEAKVMLTPGHAQGAGEPGYFRICFAFVEKDAMIEGIRRLRRVLYKRRTQLQP